MLGDTSNNNLVPLPDQNRVSQRRLLRSVSIWVLNILRDSTTSLDNPLHPPSFLPSLMLKLNFLCFSFCPLPLVLSLSTAEKSLVLSSFLPSRSIYISAQDSPEPSCLQDEEFQLSQSPLVSEMLQSLNYLCGPSLDYHQYVHVSPGKPSSGPNSRGVSHQVQAEQKDHLLQPSANVLPNACPGSFWPLLQGCIAG